MSQHTDARVHGRGTILVESGSPLFTEIVAEMVAKCGFAAAFPAEEEAPWLALTRTQPELVICDCSGRETMVRQLVVEVVARRLPLLMVAASDQQDDPIRRLVLPDRVAWLDFPVTAHAFHSVVDELVRPMSRTLHGITLSGAGVVVEAALAIRTLEEQLEGAGATNGSVVPIPDRVVRRSLRLLP